MLLKGTWMSCNTMQLEVSCLLTCTGTSQVVLGSAPVTKNPQISVAGTTKFCSSLPPYPALDAESHPDTKGRRRRQQITRWLLRLLLEETRFTDKANHGCSRLAGWEEKWPYYVHERRELAVFSSGTQAGLHSSPWGSADPQAPPDPDTRTQICSTKLSKSTKDKDFLKSQK